MTDDTAAMLFRSSDVYRPRLEEILRDPTFQKAVEIVRYGRSCEDEEAENKGLNLDAIVSVRRNSQRLGMERFIKDLLLLAAPVAPPRTETPSTFGQDVAAKKLRDLETEQ